MGSADCNRRGEFRGKDEGLTLEDEFWCELVLNGIGGRTIAEAKERISYLEYLQWIRFRNKRGSLNSGFRVELAAAEICALTANIHSKNPVHKQHDFAPHMDEPAITLDEAMKLWN